MNQWAAQTSRVWVSARSRPPLSFIPTLIGLRAFDLVSSRVWREVETNKRHLWWCNGLQAWLANLHEWIRVSLSAPFIRPCAASSKELRKLLKNVIRFGISHHHDVVPLARISLTLFRHFSLWFIASGRYLALHPVSSQSCCMYVRAGRPAFARPYVGVYRSTSLISSSLLLQQCPACLVRLTWIVLWWEVGGRIVGALWGVASRTCSILLAAFLCSYRLAFFSSRFVSVQVVHP